MTASPCSARNHNPHVPTVFPPRGELLPEVLPMLLLARIRALQEETFERVVGTVSLTVDTRMVAADVTPRRRTGVDARPCGSA